MKRRSGTKPTKKRTHTDTRTTTWKRVVKARDRQRCRMCGAKCRLEVHHIRCYISHPHLRFVPSNGLTLCRPCHEIVNGDEERYAKQFARMAITGCPYREEAEQEAAQEGTPEKPQEDLVEIDQGLQRSEVPGVPPCRSDA